MPNFNEITLIGHLTKDPEVKYTQQGTQLANFGLAVNRFKKDEVDFFNITAWDKQAKVCGDYLKKGASVMVKGELNFRDYETQDGQKRKTHTVNLRNMVMLGGKSDSDKPVKKQPKADVEEIDLDDYDLDDMPF